MIAKVVFQHLIIVYRDVCEHMIEADTVLDVAPARRGQEALGIVCGDEFWSAQRLKPAPLLHQCVILL